jgi:hypothetical protein
MRNLDPDRMGVLVRRAIKSLAICGDCLSQLELSAASSNSPHHECLGLATARPIIAVSQAAGGFCRDDRDMGRSHVSHQQPNTNRPHGATGTSS